MDPTKFKYDELLEVIQKSGVAESLPRSLFMDFKDLMRFRMNNILLVSSRYDFYTLIDDGQFSEGLYSEFLDLNIHYAPHITRVYSGEAALQALSEQKFDLVITMQRLGDMDLQSFCIKAREIDPNIPVVLLAYQSRELQLLLEKGKTLEHISRVYIWSGDRKLFLAIIKNYEDLVNAPTDCLDFGVRTIILVEDSPSFYSAYLPMIYTEVIQQSQRLISEGKNLADRLLRQRARPKILHATNYEEAWKYFEKYQETTLGIITDLKFCIFGKEVDTAGLLFTAQVRTVDPEMPILVQSSLTSCRELVEEQSASFVDKNSHTLLQEVRDFLTHNFGFGDFIFRLPTGEEVDRANNIRELQLRLMTIPEESLLFHASRDHFSNWLMARTRFRLASRLKPVKVHDFDGSDDLREAIVQIIEQHLVQDQKGLIGEFSRDNFDEDAQFQRIGDGSLGGKARGLAFIDSIFKNYIQPDFFPTVTISIPRSIVLCTNIFDEFIRDNDLFALASSDVSDEVILHDFLQAKLPDEIEQDLRVIVDKCRMPLAVRSSSLLEDALYQPFAGIYATLMLPNCEDDPEIRFHRLARAIKTVYASTYFRAAKNYLEITGQRIEEERMAVIVQEMAGEEHMQRWFYPHFSGVARSFNYYPFGMATPQDGIVNVAIGLGKTIVDGGTSLQFCPAYPNVLPQFAAQKDYFANSQKTFYALDMKGEYVDVLPSEDENLKRLDVKQADAHGTLRWLASTYSAENDTLYEGVFRSGMRVVTFAPLLNSELIPLAKILRLLLQLCERAMNTPVEIEFACTLGSKQATPATFHFLQVRPMVKGEGSVEIDLPSIEQKDILLHSTNALGNGILRIHEIVYVRPDTFEPAHTRELATEIAQLNQRLMDEGRSYLLIGPGRWGSSDPWLGIPVRFSAISGAKTIVETSLPNMLPDPSQGSHFFQNLTSLGIAYFTTRHTQEDGAIDWHWLNALPAEHESRSIRHVHLEAPIEVRVDGQTGEGIVLKRIVEEE